MKLTGHDLKQITDATLEHLSPEQLLLFSKKILADLKKAMDRLHQNPNNSSKPPSSTPPWGSNSSSQEKPDDGDIDDTDPDGNKLTNEEDNIPPDDEVAEIDPKGQNLPDIEKIEGPKGAEP